MKKRLLSLALALSLCMGLCVPALAADVSGLDAKGAKAYYDALSACGKSEWVAYADSKDMDGNSVPELVVVTSPKDNDYPVIPFLTVKIWQVKNGSAVQQCDFIAEPDQNCGIDYVTQNGKLYVRAFHMALFQGSYGSTEDFFGVDGFHENLKGQGSGESDGTFTRTVNGTEKNLTEKQFTQYQKAYQEVNGGTIFIGGGQYWSEYEGKHDETYQTVLNQLAAKASETPAPAAGTYGKFTISGSAFGQYDYTVTFDSVKVEKRQVRITDYDTEGSSGITETRTVDLVTVQPGSYISVNPIKNAFEDGLKAIPGETGIIGEDGGFTFWSTGALEPVLYDGSAEKSLQPWQVIPLNGYYVVLGTDTATPKGFTDVPANSPFKNAIDWAVEKKITAGTSKTTFSPNSPCTHNHILTFLWRANGSPAATGKNDFEKAASWAKSKGLISGSYDGGKACTRAEAMTYLWKLAGSPKTEGQYAPYTITIDDGDTVQFDAVKLKKGTFTVNETYTVVGEDTITTTEEYTVIVAKPNSKVTVKTVGEVDILMGENAIWAEMEIRANQDGTLYYEATCGDPNSMRSMTLSDTACLIYSLEPKINNYLVIPDIPAFAKVIASATDIGNSSSFADVSSTASYAQAVAWAVAQGITSGTSKTTFSPNTACTRGQIVTFLHRAMGK